MFDFSVLIGLYSYSIFVLGILGNLSSIYILFISSIFILAVFLIIKRNILKIEFLEFIKKVRQSSLLIKLLWGILIAQIVVNLVGALGPELAFDSLWYHLTIPKIFLQEGRIFHIPGNLLYYSDMPKLIDSLYISALFFSNEVIAKLIHFTFGLLILYVLYKLNKIVNPKTPSIFVLLIFYSNLVVSWLSITAYIDLGRTFFEILALYFLIYYSKTKKANDLMKSAASLGFAVSSKILSLGSLLIYLLIFIFKKEKISKTLAYFAIALFIPLPWFIFSYLNTGYPFYPFGSSTNPLGETTLSLKNLISFIRSSDPISPIYIISLPLIIAYFKKLNKMLLLYFLFSFVLLLMTPPIGGGRFIMAYLPAYSVLIASTLDRLGKIRKYFIALIIVLSFSTLGYRGIANFKYLPTVLGFESRDSFLTKHLNFSFGDFYDTDGYFKRTINNQDNVLIYGVHNLYYVNFRYVHASWVKKGDRFNYILVQGVVLPERFSNWRLIYENKTTNVKLYKPPVDSEQKLWSY